MNEYMENVHRELVKLDSLEIPEGINKRLHEYMDDLSIQPNKKGGFGLSWGTEIWIFEKAAQSGTNNTGELLS